MKFWETSNIREEFCFVISKHISVGLINVLDNAFLASFTPPRFGDQMCVRLQAEGGEWDPTLLGPSGTASVVPAIHDHLNLLSINGGAEGGRGRWC